LIVLKARYNKSDSDDIPTWCTEGERSNVDPRHNRLLLLLLLQTTGEGSTRSDPAMTWLID